MLVAVREESENKEGRRAERSREEVAGSRGSKEDKSGGVLRGTIGAIVVVVREGTVGREVGAHAVLL